MCEHDKRFSGVFFLPKEDSGCVACALERVSTENTHLETLLGQVWDAGRDNNLSWQARILKIMAAIREKPKRKG